MTEIPAFRKNLPTQIAVLGGGSWATAIIKILSENNVKIKWWLRRKSDVDFIKKYNHNPSYLTDAPLNPRKIRAYHKMHDALNGVEYVILAVPAAFVPDALKNLKKRKIEIHISNIYQREEFRQKSVTAAYTNAVLSGFGIDGYRLAVLSL